LNARDQGAAQNFNPKNYPDITVGYYFADFALQNGAHGDNRKNVCL
jgi:hypothetical protein